MLRVFAAGSSPRIRGKPREPRPTRTGWGLIPAHTGKTCGDDSGRRRPRAHPRAYGENAPPKNRRRSRRGSSPRIRGKPVQKQLKVNAEGLIPAHTGKTRELSQKGDASRAHPRAYGENTALFSPLSRRLGSSPRIRGKPSSSSQSPAKEGLIPAHTGKTLPLLA